MNVIEINDDTCDQCGPHVYDALILQGATIIDQRHRISATCEP